jgi:hypothetical protein
VRGVTGNIIADLDQGTVALVVYLSHRELMRADLNAALGASKPVRGGPPPGAIGSGPVGGHASCRECRAGTHGLRRSDFHLLPKIP